MASPSARIRAQQVRPIGNANRWTRLRGAILSCVLSRFQNRERCFEKIDGDVESRM